MCVKYDRSDLLQIRQKVQSSETSNSLSLDTIKVIRKIDSTKEEKGQEKTTIKRNT